MPDPSWFKSGGPPPAGLINWDLSAPRVLTLAAAGHAPGLYQLQVCFFVTTAAGAGNCNAPVFAWSEPVFGATTLVLGALPATATGLGLTVLRNVFSSGVNPITFTITPASITGSPKANLIGAATFVCGPVT